MDRITSYITCFFFLIVLLSCHTKNEYKNTRVEPPVTQENKLKISYNNVKEVAPFDYDTLEWAEILPTKNIQLDIRYASINNFTKQQIYDCGRCFLRPSTARKFYRLVDSLSALQYGVKLFDCYRPHAAQNRLWEIVPNPMYVADPKKGSMHNRGLAIDLTLTDFNGSEIDMGTPFDFFGHRAYHDYSDLPDTIYSRRIKLKNLMASFGFQHTRTEWWHYSDSKDWADISNFEWKCPPIVK